MFQIIGIGFEYWTEIRQHAFGERKHDTRETFFHNELSRVAVARLENEGADAFKNRDKTVAPNHAPRGHHPRNLRCKSPLCSRHMQSQALALADLAFDATDH